MRDENAARRSSRLKPAKTFKSRFLIPYQRNPHAIVKMKTPNNTRPSAWASNLRVPAISSPAPVK